MIVGICYVLLQKMGFQRQKKLHRLLRLLLNSVFHDCVHCTSKTQHVVILFASILQLSKIITIIFFKLFYQGYLSSHLDILS